MSHPQAVNLLDAETYVAMRKAARQLGPKHEAVLAAQYERQRETQKVAA